MMKLFDSHCHLTSPSIIHTTPKLIKEALDTGVSYFALNGISEEDWPLVKKMSENYPCIVPNFGLHPWYITDRTPNWLNVLKEFLESTPSAAVGEIGLDKSSIGPKTDFTDQVDIFIKQLRLAKELNRPASVHCLCAFDELLDILESMGPFPAGFIMHSYCGTPEMVPRLHELGGFFSLSGHLMNMEENEAKEMLNAIPLDRILLETDAPSGRPKLNIYSDSLFLIEREDIVSEDGYRNGTDDSSMSSEEINHPANIHYVLDYVAHLLEMNKEELAVKSYQNAIRLFSFEGSKVASD